MDPYSAFLSLLDSKIDVFKNQMLADVQSFIKETEKIQDSRESEITKLKKAIDDRTLCHENDKANWRKERDILRNNAEEPVQENEDLGFDNIAYLNTSVHELVYGLLEPERKQGKFDQTSFMVMVKKTQNEIVSQMLNQLAGQVPNTKDEIDDYMSSSRKSMIMHTYDQFDEFLAKMAITAESEQQLYPHCLSKFQAAQSLLAN